MAFSQYVGSLRTMMAGLLLEIQAGSSKPFSLSSGSWSVISISQMSGMEQMAQFRFAATEDRSLRRSRKVFWSLFVVLDTLGPRTSMPLAALGSDPRHSMKSMAFGNQPR